MSIAVCGQAARTGRPRGRGWRESKRLKNRTPGSSVEEPNTRPAGHTHSLSPTLTPSRGRPRPRGDAGGAGAGPSSPRRTGRGAPGAAGGAATAHLTLGRRETATARPRAPRRKWMGPSKEGVPACVGSTRGQLERARPAWGPGVLRAGGPADARRGSSSTEGLGLRVRGVRSERRGLDGKRVPGCLREGRVSNYINRSGGFFRVG